MGLIMTIESIIKDLQSLAKQTPNIEVCGVIDNTFKIHPITNVAKNKQSCFVFDKREYFTLIKALKNESKCVLFIYHSHPSNNVTPSATDIAFTKRSGLPQIIVGTNKYTLVEHA